MKSLCLDHLTRMYDYKTQTCEDCHLNERIRKEICPLYCTPSNLEGAVTQTLDMGRLVRALDTYSRQTKPNPSVVKSETKCNVKDKTADTSYVEPIAMQQLTELEQRVAFGNMQLDEIDYKGGGLKI